MGAFRGRGRLLAGARVPPEPSRRLLALQALGDGLGRLLSVGRVFLDGVHVVSTCAASGIDRTLARQRAGKRPEARGRPASIATQNR